MPFKTKAKKAVKEIYPAKPVSEYQKERISYADSAVRAYLQAKGEEHTMPLCDTDLSDMLADLYHFADHLDFDREEMEERALMHYTAEKAEYEGN